MHCSCLGLFSRGISVGSRSSAMEKIKIKQNRQIPENRETPYSETGCFLGNWYVCVKPKQKMTNYS